jgi:hypothetical protein
MLYCFVIVYSVGKSSVPIYFSLNIMPELASFVILWVVVSESCRPYLDTSGRFRVRQVRQYRSRGPYGLGILYQYFPILFASGNGVWE